MSEPSYPIIPAKARHITTSQDERIDALFMAGRGAFQIDLGGRGDKLRPDWQRKLDEADAEKRAQNPETAKPQPERTEPKFRDTKANRRAGYQILAEIQRVAKTRIKRGEDVDWRGFGYAMAVTLRTFEARRERYDDPRFKAWQIRWTWPECNTTSALRYCSKNAPFGAARDEPIPQFVIDEVERGMARAEKRGRGFLTADEYAMALGVTDKERTRLDLRRIGAIDFRKPQREARAAAKKLMADLARDPDKRRKQDRERKAKNRREAGMRPQADSIAAMARALGVKPDTLRARLCRQKAQANAINANASVKPCRDSVHVAFLSAPHPLRSNGGTEADRIATSGAAAERLPPSASKSTSHARRSGRGQAAKADRKVKLDGLGLISDRTEAETAWLQLVHWLQQPILDQKRNLRLWNACDLLLAA